MPFLSASRIFAALFSVLMLCASASVSLASGLDTTGTSMPFNIEGTQVMTMTTTGLGIGTTAPVAVLDVSPGGNTQAASVTISARGTSVRGNSFEWGHSNQSGYGSVLGFETGSGQPFLCFNCESGSNTNTFRTRGIEGIAIESDNLGDLTFNNVASANADLQSLTERMRIASSGNVGIGATNPQRTLDVSTSGQMTFGDNVSATATATGIYWHSVTPNGSPDTAGTYGIFRTPGAWSGNYAQLEMEFPTGIIIDGGSCCGKSGTMLQPHGGNVGIGMTPTAPLDVNGGIRGNSSGTVAGSGCSPEGMLAYDMTGQQPVYCNHSGVWADVNASSAFMNRTWTVLECSNNNNFGTNYGGQNTHSYPIDVSAWFQNPNGAGGQSIEIMVGTNSNFLADPVIQVSNIGAGQTSVYAVVPPGEYWGVHVSTGNVTECVLVLQ
jgi:hypothetical protein